MKILSRSLSGVLVVLMAVVGIAGPASAHAQLESTQPDPLSVLLTSPSQVVLHFGEPVEIDFGSLRVIGPDGKRVDLGGTHHPPRDGHAVAISLPPHLPKGTYVVVWRVISADSHPVHGAFIFSVGTAIGAGKASSLVKNLSNASGNPLNRDHLLADPVRCFHQPRAPRRDSLRRHPRLAPRRRDEADRQAAVDLVGDAPVLQCGRDRGSGCVRGGPSIDGHHSSLFLFDEVLHTRFGEIEVLRVILLLAFVPIVLGVRGNAAERVGPGGFHAEWP